MQKNSNIETSSLLVLLSVLTIILQFLVYYLFASPYLILGIAFLVSVICTHILLEHSQTYQTGFVFNILNIFISGIITFLTYSSKNNSFFPYSGTMIWIVAINWFIPSIYCFLRNMFDYGTRIDNYNTYFRNESIVFVVFYIGIVIYGSFAGGAFPWAYRMAAGNANFNPFWSIATQIEDYLNHMIPLSDIVTYLFSRILIYIPYGYFITIVLRRRPKIIKFFALFIFPIIIELFQYIYIAARCDIDDIIYGIIGGIFGTLFFHLINIIFRTVSGRDFLENNSDMKYNNHLLHF